jgi:hypothetical protein
MAMRHAMLMAVVSLSLTVGCDKSSTKADTAAKTADAKGPDVANSPDSDEPRDEKAASFAQPKTEPPPGPPGTITLPEPFLYVQTCVEPPCPDLLQPAGDAHCRELQIGGHVNWRLPSKDEVARFRGVEQLEARAGYHWTRTPFDDDIKQVWIVDPEDPEGAPATTIPRDRKPFRVRCVKEP